MKKKDLSNVFDKLFWNPDLIWLIDQFDLLKVSFWVEMWVWGEFSRKFGFMVDIFVLRSNICQHFGLWGKHFLKFIKILDSEIKIWILRSKFWILGRKFVIIYQNLLKFWILR